MTSTYEDRTLLATDVAIKAPCRAATTAAITLSGLQTVDGIALVANDRVLVKNQASGADNGIYLASSGAWTRTADFDGNRDAVDGTIVLVRLGIASALSLYKLTCATTPPIIGTTSLTFTLVSIIVGNAGSFTTLTASGQITSSLATGTAPFVITSTTKVANLNADKLDGTDWVAPGPIGTGTPDAATFTTMTATTINGTVATAAQPNVTSLGTLAATTVLSAGGGSGTEKPIGVLNVQTTAVGNIGAGTDDLLTYSLPASSLSANQKGFRVTAWGNTANNANAKTLRFTFGTTDIATAPMTANIPGEWRFTCEVLRTGASTQNFTFTMIEESWTGGLTATHKTLTRGSNTTQTDTNILAVKCTGTAIADNDIVQNGMIVEFIN